MLPLWKADDGIERGEFIKKQNIGLGDLVRSDVDQVQGVVVGGSLDGSRVSLDTRTGGEGYGARLPTVDRESCELVEKGYDQKLQKMWRNA